MTAKRFSKLVESAVEGLPREFLDLLENVSITVADYPSIYQTRRSGVKGLLLGLYEGVPQTRRGNYTGVPPDKITIFKLPILYIAKSSADVERIVRDTVVHEIAHHFGMDELQVRSAEAKRGARN